MYEHVIQILNEGKKDGKIQTQIIKGILSLSQMRREELLTQYYLSASQCIDKNIELIGLIRTFSHYPDLFSLLQPYTGYTMRGLQYLARLSETLTYSVPTMPAEIVAVDRELRYLLCPGSQNGKEIHTHSERLEKSVMKGSADRRSELGRLRLLLAEKENLIRAQRIQIAKMKTQLSSRRNLGS